MKFWEKNFLCIIRSDFLESLVDKSNLNLTIVQLFIGLYALKIRIYIVCIIIRTNGEICSYKNAKLL